MDHGELTSPKYWDQTYIERKKVSPIELTSWKNLCSKNIFLLKNKIGLEQKTIMEIGGGGSPWLAYLAEKFPSSQFTCLDYSDDGINSLAQYASARELNNIDFIKDDFFTAHNNIKPQDFVFSHGVVEHFKDLPSVLRSHGEYLSKDGVMLTIIPNMAGVLGLLTRWLNREIYEIHVPHNLNSLVRGHNEAGLTVIESGHLCSNNFSVLSSCVRRRRGLKWFIYKNLSRLSKIIWLFEDKILALPRSKSFSPYLYVIAKK